MANMRLSNGCRNDILNGIRNRIDAGKGPGTITLYDGKQPATVHATVGSAKQVGVLTFAEKSAPDASHGALSFNPIAECFAANITAKPKWARIADGDGNAVFDCDVSDENGDGTLRLNTIDIKAGGPIRITEFAMTYPAA